MSDDILKGLAEIDQRLSATKQGADRFRAEGRGVGAEELVPVLTTLVATLESALKVASQRIRGVPEPFPGAAEYVISQALDTVEITRRSGLLPPRKVRA